MSFSTNVRWVLYQKSKFFKSYFLVSVLCFLSGGIAIKSATFVLDISSYDGPQLVAFVGIVIYVLIGGLPFAIIASNRFLKSSLSGAGDSASGIVSTFCLVDYGVVSRDVSMLVLGVS